MQKVNHEEYKKELQKCEKTMVHKPISNYFDEQSGKIIHVPSFSPCLCAGCGSS